MTNLICFSITRWSFMRQRPQQLMSLFSRDFRVAYVSPPRLADIDPGAEIKLDDYTKFINPNLMVLAPPRPQSLTPSPRVKNYFVGLMKKFIEKYDFNNPVLWLNLPEALYMCGELGEKLVIYDCVDDYSSFSWTPDYTAEADRILTRKADIVTVVSPPLYQQKATENANCFLIPNGCDFSHFNKALTEKLKVPEDIASLKRPRIGFIGALWEWIDFELISYLADRNRNWSITLVGPKHFRVKTPRAPNIHYLGRKRYRLLPNYLQQFDVCMIPFKLTDTGIGSSPIKLYEYLASGKPVVSTNIPESARFKGVVAVAGNKEEFCSLVRMLLKEDARKREKRLTRQLLLARETTWETRYNDIKRIMAGFVRD